MGIATEVVDGMDVRATASAADAALAAVRSGTGPRFIEAETYRYVPHSRSDPVTYQPEDEVERWRARDPLDQERARLLDEGVDGRRTSTPWSGASRRTIAEAIRARASTTRSRIRRRIAGAEFA